MVYNEKRKQSMLAYRKKNVRRIAVDIGIAEYNAIKAAADSANESLSGYVRKACAQRMQRERDADV